jgi:hypothetical protein
LTEQELGELSRVDFSAAGKEVAVAFDRQLRARIEALRGRLPDDHLLAQTLNLGPPKD